LSRAPEANDQFNNHLATFQRAIGSDKVQFQHAAWMAQQYHSFGELLEAAPATQALRSRHHNGGFFFQTAASFAIQRKKLAMQVIVLLL
jgi:hypothetical protein